MFNSRLGRYDWLSWGLGTLTARVDSSNRERRQIAFGLVTYNSADDLRQTLAHTARIAAEIGAEVLIHDNDSTDDTVDVASAVEGVVVQRGQTNGGFAHGVNCLFTLAGDRDLLLINPDVEIKDAEQVMHLFAELDEGRIGLVAPRLLNPDGSVQESARRFPTLLGMAGRSTLARHLSHAQRAAREYTSLPPGDRRSDVDWVIGAAMAISREANAAVGGWDERFFLYLEDVDFCLRLRRHGWAVIYDPTVSFHHTHRRASDPTKGSLLASEARRHHVRSTLRFFLKHRSTRPGARL